MAGFTFDKKFKNKSGQDIQDEIFRKMSADRKIEIASRLTMFCLELSKLNHYAARNNRPKKSRSQHR